MQKKIIALAIAGLASSAAFAADNVTIYGRLDLGYQYRVGGGDHSQAAMDSGLEGGSRLGFKGAEDLGNGLKSIFEVEFGSLKLDQNGTGNNNGIDNTRHAYVGLTGGFGTVVAGRLDGVRYGVFNHFDPFAGGGMGNFTQMSIQVDRADNAIAYISPTFSGFGVVAAYSTNIAGPEAAGNVGDATLQTLMGTYDNGPISARLDYEQVVKANTNGKTYVATAGASYDFGVAKVSALYDMIKDTHDTATANNTTDQRSWFVGASAPVGKFNLKAVVGQTKDKLNDAKGTKWGLGADYNLSKRTNFYVDYGQIHNNNNGNFKISAAANSNEAGYGTAGADMGIAHKF